MKKLILPVYKKRDYKGKTHPYYILFNIGQRLEFTNKRKAEDYARLVSSYVVDSIRLLNTVQKELYTIYLDNYFLLNDGQIMRAQKSLDEYLERLPYFHRYQSRGDASIRFTSVYTLLNIVENSCKILKRSFKKNKDYNTVSRLVSLLQIITTIYEKFAALKKGEVNTVYKESKLLIVHKNRGVSMA